MTLTLTCKCNQECPLFFFWNRPETRLNHGLCLSCPWAGHQNLNLVSIRSASFSQNKTPSAAAAGLDSESWWEQDSNHVILSPAPLHLTSIYYNSFFSPLNLSRIQNHHLDLFGSASILSDGAVSYLNELWLTGAWPSLELESDRDSTRATVQPINILQILNQAFCKGQ